MSITADTAKQHANDPAVLCCRAEEGTVIGPANLETFIIRYRIGNLTATA